LKRGKYIKFRNKRIIPDIFNVRINKDNKITKPSEENIGAGPQTSLKINSSGAEVL
jgi:hypothetical protein